MQRPYILSCHCEAIRLEVDTDLAHLVECNCSTCARSGFIRWLVPTAAVRLLTEKRNITTYMWRDAAGLQFCPTCGTGMMRTGYPNDHISLNARCLEGIDVFKLEVSRYDGRSDMPPGPRL